jgi:hypothetical protein
MAGLAAILLPSPLPAQITFQRTYGGEHTEKAYSVQQTIDGGYILAGRTMANSGNHNDVYLIKTDAYGDTVWTRSYGDTTYEAGYSVRQTADSGFVVVGYFLLDSGSKDVYVLRTNSNGDTLWTRTYGGPEYDRGYSGQETFDDGFIITGSTSSYGAGGRDVYVVRTDALGETLWTRTYGGPDDDFGCAMQQTADNGYIIAGHTFSYGAGEADVYLVKTDARGDTLWTRAYGGHSNDYGRSVWQTSDGGYVIAGRTGSFGAGSSDAYLIRTNGDGNALWSVTYGGVGYDMAYSVQQTSDGGYILAGASSSFGSGGADVYLIKTDSCGDTLWTKTFGGAADDSGYSVQQTTDGGYIVAGSADPPGGAWPDVYLIKTDSLGNVAVAEPKASPTRAPALSLSCEPNPFRTRTAISLQLTADSPAELAIFDAAGRCVRTFTVNREPYTVWDGKDDFGQPLPSGAYFVRVDAGNEHATARLVLQR